MATGVNDLLSTLHHIRSRLNSADNTSSGNGSQEVFFLKQLFHNQQFQQAVAVHQKMVEVTSRSPQPRSVGSDSQALAADITASSDIMGIEPALKELTVVLDKPHVKVRWNGLACTGGSVQISRATVTCSPGKEG